MVTVIQDATQEDTESEADSGQALEVDAAVTSETVIEQLEGQTVPSTEGSDLCSSNWF